MGSDGYGTIWHAQVPHFALPGGGVRDRPDHAAGAGTAIGARHLQRAGRDQVGLYDRGDHAGSGSRGRPAEKPPASPKATFSSAERFPQKQIWSSDITAPAGANRFCCWRTPTSWKPNARTGAWIRSNSSNGMATSMGAARPTIRRRPPCGSRTSSVISAKASNRTGTSSWRLRRTKRAAALTTASSG